MDQYPKQMIRQMRQLARSARWPRLARLWWFARHGAHHDWAGTLKQDGARWQAAKQAATGPRILMASSVGLHFAATRLDGLLAVALTLRGARVDSLLCEGLLPVCMAADVSWEKDPAGFADHGMDKAICRQCHGPAIEALDGLGLPTAAYGDFVTEAVRAEIAERAHTVPADAIAGAFENGIAVGEHALAGCLRFFGRGTLTSTPHWESVLRAYFQAALLTEAALTERLHRDPVDIVVCHHGIYVPQGIVAAVARREGVRVVTWNMAYRDKCFIFSHGDSYHHTMINEPADAWANLELSTGDEAEIAGYLESRARGSRDWISFHPQPEEDLHRLEREFGLDPAQPRVGLLTNVFWDAQLHFTHNIFASMREWLVETIRYYAGRPDVQLVIRVHPAEITGAIPSREPVREILRESFEQLPPNVVVVPPDSRASTYVLMKSCDAVIIYGTKTGIELAAIGKPVIVAGEAWIRNKGLSLDPESKEEYFDLLNSLPFKGEAGNVNRARALTYAYHFFFRRMIPIQCMEPASGFPPFRIGDIALADLEPGRDLGLDVICDGILTGAPFIYPAESQDRLT